MRKFLTVAALSALALCPFAPGASFAEEDNGVQVGKDVFVAFGYKAWINTWQTNLTGSGVNWEQLVKGPVLASIPNMSIRVKNFLLAGSYMSTGDYKFPSDSYYVNFPAGSAIGTLKAPVTTGSRTEGDFNIGYYVHRSVLLTMGYKGVTEKFSVYDPLSKATTESKVYYNGVTLGIAGSVPVGAGFAIYGNGVGGWLSTTYQPASTYLDNAMYEASELGVAYKVPHVPFSMSAGYKFQLIQTHINSLNLSAANAQYTNLPRSDVTRGFMIGLNCVF